MTIFALVPVRAQQSITYIEVDTLTFNAYLAGDWDKILEIGDKALESEIDYYYLRMRMGFALFKKSRYRMAIPHYKKALEFSNNSATAYEYLYYCYQYSGRVQDAEKLIAQFPEALKKSLELTEPNRITDLSLFVSYGTGASEEAKNEIINHAPTNINGTQKMPNSYMNYNVNLKHSIGHNLILDHSIHYLNKDEFALSVLNSAAYLSESQTLKQFNYHLGIEITPISGLTIKPFFSLIHYKIPIFYDYGFGSGRDRQVYDYITNTDFTLGLKANKQLSILDIGMAGIYSELNNIQQLTGALSLTIYPLNNLNLYYTGRVNFHQQVNESTTITQIFQVHEIGFKVFRHLWVELNTVIGDHSNFYDPFTQLTYNGLEQHRIYSDAKIIVPLYKSEISLFASYRYHESTSFFAPESNPLNTINNIEYNYQTITGGIIWKL